jgi:hypothetical protein
MPVQPLLLALVIIAGSAFGVIVGRVLAAVDARQEPDVAPVEPLPVRQLDAVLAPYEHVAAA